MFRGEFESAKAIHDATPDFGPEPIAWGRYQSDPNTYFLLERFIDMVDNLPAIDTLPEKLAEMHNKAVAPNGKYGFHMQTMTALLPQYVTESKSWEEFFSNYMRHLMAAERISQGPADEEQERLTRVFFDRIIPRLIRPLETGGREITPRLVHSDIWDGNAATNSDTDGPVIFDASCFYAHRECRCPALPCPRNQQREKKTR